MKPLLAFLPKGIVSIVATDGEDEYIVISRQIPEREQIEAFRIQELIEGEDDVAS